MLTSTRSLSDRALAMLRAVATNRAEMFVSSEPDLRVDGLPCSDQMTSHELAHAGLIQPARPAMPGHWVRAVITPAGQAALHPHLPDAA